MQVSINEDASISANFTKPFKNKSDRLWGLGGKASADDGTYYLFKGSELNFTAGLKLSFTLLKHSNGFYYDSLTVDGIATCYKIFTSRQDTISLLLNEIYMILKEDTAKLSAEIENINVVLEKNQNKILDSVSDMDSLLNVKKSLRARLDKVHSFNENKKEYGLIGGAKNYMWNFEKGIIEKYSTGYHLNWWDFRLGFDGAGKNILDLTDAENDYTPLKPFFKGSFETAFNYYHLGNKTLWYFRGQLSLGNGYGYDLLSPDDIELDTTLLINSGNNLNKVGEKMKAFNQYTDSLYGQSYFVPKLGLTGNIFIGKNKIVGFEANCEIGAIIGEGKVKAPFNWHAGILFSPIDKNKKSNDGTIGLLVGMNKMDLSNPDAIGKKNVTVAVRVGLPLSAPMTRK